MRIAVASCQQYEHGYYGAYRHMLADDLDLILHLGDYIYELSWGNQHVRHHASPEAYTLDDYRTRHALYRSDRDLQAAHAAYPWLLTWDDHEVDNDYAGAISEEDDSPELFLTRRAGAYRAFYEHMPLPRRAVSFGSHLRLYANRGFGQLLNIFMLDTRQYRAPHACAPPGRRGASAANCPELYDPARSKLGATQEQWLAARMTASRTRWNLFGQGTVMAYVDEQAGQGERFWTDGWNGYPAARGRFIDTVVRTRVSNPVILSGDIHAFLVANHHRVPQDRSSPMVASEFVTTSISSQGLAQRTLDERRAENPNLLFASSERRGYVRLDVTPERLQADLMAMESVARADAGHFVQASFFVEDGRPGPIAADSGTR